MTNKYVPHTQKCRFALIWLHVSDQGVVISNITKTEKSHLIFMVIDLMSNSNKQTRQRGQLLSGSFIYHLMCHLKARSRDIHGTYIVSRLLLDLDIKFI